MYNCNGYENEVGYNMSGNCRENSVAGKLSWVTNTVLCEDRFFVFFFFCNMFGSVLRRQLYSVASGKVVPEKFY